MGTLLIIVGIYLLYTFIADFIIPVYRASKQVQQQFRNMHQQRPDAGTDSLHAPTQPKAPSRDYIDFEEVKD